jgi:hypothetical protein
MADELVKGAGKTEAHYVRKRDSTFDRMLWEALDIRETCYVESSGES